MQAAYKALTCNQFTEVLHLGGGVYGAHDPRALASQALRFCTLRPAGD